VCRWKILEQTDKVVTGMGITKDTNNNLTCDIGSNIWMLYAGIILHGICYDFFFVTGQIYTDNRAGNAIKSSAQGLITFATYGLGMLIGSYTSGFLTEKYASTVNSVVLHYQWKSVWLHTLCHSGNCYGLFCLVFQRKII